MDATGVTRYLPVFIYPKGAPEKAAYIGHRLEGFQHQAKPLWTPETLMALERLGRRHAEGGRLYEEGRA